LREINLTCRSDVDGGRGDDAKDAHSASSPSIPAPGKRTPYQFLKIKGAKIQEKLKRVPSIAYLGRGRGVHFTQQIRLNPINLYTCACGDE
jgi:hypothetical protein